MRKLSALKKLATNLGIDCSVEDLTNANIGEVLDVIAEKISEVPTEIIVKSSTPESTKQFKITVVDDGTISATEIE